MAREFDASAHYGRRIADVHDDGIAAKDPLPGRAPALPAVRGPITSMLFERLVQVERIR